MQGGKMKLRIDLKIIIFMIIFGITKQLRIYIIVMFFCFLHELGHIICGHFELEEDLIHLPDYKHEILEKEANAFASELLAPTSLLQIHIGAGNITSWHGVKENFSVSCQEAQILFNRVYYPSNKEIALYRCDEILTSLIFMQKNTLAPTRVSSNRKA